LEVFYRVIIVVVLGMIISIALLSMFMELRSMQKIKVIDVDLSDVKLNDTQLYLTLYIHFYNPANISIVINELKYDVYLEKIKVISVSEENIKLEKEVKMLKIPLEISLEKPIFRPILKAAALKHVLNYRVNLYVRIYRSSFLGIFRREYTSHSSVEGLISLEY